MKVSINGRKFIEQWEGLVLVVTDDGFGTPTGGYGHTNAAGPPRIQTGQRLTAAEADQWLAADLSRVERIVQNLVKVPLNQNQFDALCSFEFNTGALHQSSSLLLLNAGQYEQCAQHLQLYNKAGHPLHVVQGLVNRRHAESALFLKPVQPSIPVATPTVNWLAQLITRIFK